MSSFENLANAYSTYPIAPGVWRIVAATPSFFSDATNLSPAGHFTVVPTPGTLFHSSLIAARCVVNTNVVPLLSAHHRDVLIGQVHARIGGLDLRVAPLRDLGEEDGGVHVAGQLELLRGRHVVGDGDLARGHRHELDAARDLGDLLVGHRGVARRDVHRLAGEVLDASSAIHVIAAVAVDPQLKLAILNLSHRLGCGVDWTTQPTSGRFFSATVAGTSGLTLPRGSGGSARRVRRLAPPRPQPRVPGPAEEPMPQRRSRRRSTRRISSGSTRTSNRPDSDSLRETPGRRASDNGLDAPDADAENVPFAARRQRPIGGRISALGQERADRGTDA